MKSHAPRTARAARRLLLACALAARAFTRLRGDPAPAAQQLQPLIVSATRSPASADTLGTVVDVYSAADLAQEQIVSFSDALQGAPAAPVFATGRFGASTSLFLRGANSNQTLFLVDGIRISDANTDYSVWLGGSRVCSCDSLEIAHGPQSTLFGGEAIGGVVSVRAEKGSGTPTETVAAEAGSFGTVQGALGAKGEEGPWAYNFSAAGGHTDNERANNDFDSENTTLRIDRALRGGLSAGATFRGFTGRYGDPGDRYTNNLLDFERENNWLGTAFLQADSGDGSSSRLTLGGQDRRFVAVVPSPGRAASVTVVRNRRAVADGQTSYQLSAQDRLTAGATAESDTTRNTGFGNIDKRQNLFGVFAQDEWSPLSNVYLTGGLRYDHYDDFGGATTGRATVAWLLADRALKLRSSYGTGFESPSFLDLYGQSAFYVGNPNLKPERGRGGDAGLDYYLPEGGGAISASWFRTDFSDLIVDNFNVFPATTANVQNARTDGIEFSATLRSFFGTNVRAAYTYLAALNLTSQTQLLRRPRNSASIEFWRDLGGITVGAGAVWVGTRADVDALTFATVPDPSYSVFRLYGAWQATKRVAFKARIENLFDRKYEPVNGYPALGLGAFAGAEVKL